MKGNGFAFFSLIAESRRETLCNKLKPGIVSYESEINEINGGEDEKEEGGAASRKVSPS
jgi:hypothetical protein